MTHDTEHATVGPSRPRRRDVVAAYDLGVAAYETLWSPVILPPAEALAAELTLTGGELVVDVGAGTGALLPALTRRAPTARVVALDASAEMLRVARSRTGAAAVRGDALALPIADATADAVLLAYVLFHLADPMAALREAARVLRRDGRVGTITWAREGLTKAHEVWDETLAAAGVPAAPLRRVDAGLDNPTAVAGLLTSAGFTPSHTWRARLVHHWDPSAFWQLVTGSGVNRARLASVDEAERRGVLAHARQRLDALEPADFRWWGEVVCAIGTLSHL